MTISFDNIEVLGIKTILPDQYIDFRKKIDLPSSELNRLIQLTGIEGVHEAPFNKTAFDLNYEASVQLINEMKFNKDEIDCIINVSQTREHILPQTSCLIENKLGCSNVNLSFDLPIGCSGYIYGLFQACLLISSGSANHVLITSGDTTRKIINQKDNATNLLFGDAGSATIISKGKKKVYFQIGNDGSGSEKLIVKRNDFRKKNPTKTNLNKEINKAYSLEMDGLAIFNFAMKRVPIQIKGLMNKFPEFIPENFIFHQANEFLIKSLARKLKLNPDSVPLAMKYYGNTGPASIPLVISENNENKKLGKSALCGFGVGLSWGTCMIDLTNTYVSKPSILKN